MSASETTLLRTIEAIKGLVDLALFGSTYITGSGNDIDYLVLVEDAAVVIDDLLDDGWGPDGGVYNSSEFTSLRKGEVNLVITDDASYYTASLAAARICKYLLNVVGFERVATSKDFRITIHAAARGEFEWP